MGPLNRELLDSTVVIDLLNGVPAARALMAQPRAAAISIVTWIEVMAGARGAPDEAIARRYLTQFQLVHLSEGIAEETVRIRRERRLKLPDAIILATAHHLGCVLVTRNTRDFEEGPEIRVPYRL